MDRYCSELRLAFNRTVVLRYRIFLQQKPNALSPCGRFFSDYCDAIEHKYDPTDSGRVRVWVSGFFGSGARPRGNAWHQAPTRGMS